MLGIGRVVGDYIYDPSNDFPHHRPVEWLSLDEWTQPDQQSSIEGKLTTVYRMKKESNLLEAEKRIYGREPIITYIPPFHSPELNSQSTPVPRLTGIPARIQAILERKGQVILYGPPGTGKTYWAENTARELAARSNFNRTFEQLTKEQQALVLGGNGQQGGFVRLCSFHPAYGYEDFLEGFRPEPINGQMHFILRDGIFKKLCSDAEAHPDRKFYLIIDEINRGDIPRIFGELLTVLEKDKRGKAILLPLTGRPFRVPGNVFIIGTMNTADRSIALLDTALRRRFGFIELMPDINILGDAMVGGIPLGPWLKALNERICEYVGRDARNLQIGHSYLLEKGRPIGDFATFSKILHEDILPLLEEYCYEDYAILEKILGPGMVDLKNQQIRQGLFDLANRDILTDALLVPDPEITTSQQAVSAEAKAASEEGSRQSGWFRRALMSRPITSIDIKEWTRKEPTETGSSLTGLFLEESGAVKQVAKKLSESGMLTILELREGLSIETTSYVGRITLGNIQITVHPKISGIPLVRLLRYAYNLRDLNINSEATFSSETQAFQELLIQQLIEEVNELVTRGLHRRYIRTDDLLANPRGRIDLQRIAKQNGVNSGYPSLCLLSQT